MQGKPSSSGGTRPPVNAAKLCKPGGPPGRSRMAMPMSGWKKGAPAGFLRYVPSMDACGGLSFPTALSWALRMPEW